MLDLGGDSPVLDVPYTWNFYKHMSPLEISLVAALNGLGIRPQGEPFTYCELGCGNGMTANVLAASFPHGDFYAIDMNPEHVGNGREIAMKGNVGNISFLESTFEALLGKDLPKFDYIVLHGVYSWVSPKVRGHIRNIIGEFLAPDGLACVSYNAMPGWSYLLPIRQFLCELAVTVEGDSCKKMAKALKRLEYIRDQGADFFQQVPGANIFLNGLLKKKPNYLAHEYFNDSWHPQYFSEVTTEMAEIDLAYCGSMDRYKEQTHKKFAERLPEIQELNDDPIAIESLNSLIVGENFRRDVFCRKNLAKRRAGLPALENWLFGPGMTKGPKMPVLSTNDPKLMRLVLPAVMRCNCIVGDIIARPEFKSFSRTEVVGLIQNLLIAGVIQPYTMPMSDGGLSNDDKLHIIAPFNRTVLKARALQESSVYLASPVLGNGLPVPSVYGLILLARDEVSLEEAPGWVWQHLKSAGKDMSFGGKKIANKRAFTEYNQKIFSVFQQKWLPMLGQLGIIEMKAGEKSDSTRKSTRAAA